MAGPLESFDKWENVRRDVRRGTIIIDDLEGGSVHTRHSVRGSSWKLQLTKICILDVFLSSISLALPGLYITSCSPVPYHWRLQRCEDIPGLQVKQTGRGQGWALRGSSDWPGQHAGARDMPNRAAVKPGQREISGVGSAQSGRFRREKEDIKDVELPVNASGGARESERV